MRTMLAVALAIGAFFVGGCAGVSSEGKNGEKLTVQKPMNEMLKRGERGEVLVVINRDKFDEDVKLDVNDLPDGVKVLNPSLVIGRGANTLTLVLQADSDAQIVDGHVVTVEAKGPDGMKVTQTFEISVRAAS